jgi:hypothetical protein
MIHATRTIDVFASPEQTTATKALVFTGGPRDGELINDGRSRMTAGDCLSRNAAEATAPEVAAFAKALAAVEGVPQSMPLHVRQMGVYYGWYDFDEITPQGRAVIEIAARAAVSGAEVKRNVLHTDAQARKEAARIDGAERQRAFNEAQASAARARRDEEEKERVARRERRRQWRAALDFAQASAAASESTWVPNAVPVIAWLRPEAALALQAYASASGKTLSAAVQDILERATS